MRFLLLLALTGALAVPCALAQEKLLLEVWLAGQQGDTIPVTAEDGHLWIAAADFQALHLSLPMKPEGGRIDLAHLPGLAAKIDQTSQRLKLEVATEALPKQEFNLRPEPAQDITPSGTGTILHYNFNATSDDLVRMGRSVNGGGDFTLDVFMPRALLHNTGYLALGGGGWHAARLETGLVFDNPQDMTHLALGDSINGTPDWGRSVRFAGIQYASDFELRPGLVTQPLPSFFGQSAVPATVDVFNGAVKVYQQQVGAGPFSLRNLPVVTGGGNATIVTTDVLGRQTSQTIALFSDAGMLAPGLESFSFDAGFLRHGFGDDSFGYRDALVSGLWRKGLSEAITVEAHGEASGQLAMAGMGAEIGLGHATVSADIAASHGAVGDGVLASLTAQALLGSFNVYARAMTASSGFRDLASLDGNRAPPVERYQLGGSWSLNETWHGAGTLGASYLESRNPGEEPRRFLTASWSADLPNDMFVSLTALRDMASHDIGLQLGLSMPIGGGDGYAGFSAQTGNGESSADLVYSQPANPDGGWGWRGLMGSENGGRAQAAASYVGTVAAVDATLAQQAGHTGLQANADGAVVLLRGSLFMTHNPGNAVALVETGAKDVRIYLENREVARSDAHGRALITGLTPYAVNRITIDPRDYPFETQVEQTELTVTPRRHSGVTASLAPTVHKMTTVAVEQAGGMPLGTRVMLDGDTTPIWVGRGGKFQVADLKAPRGATVIAGDSRCRIMIDPAQTAPLLCLREARSVY